MGIVLPYENARDLAYAVKDEIPGPEIMAFPYNRFQPEESDWWLSPGKENPAYHRGKYVFDPTGELDAGIALVGFHIEKGFGELVSEVSASAREARQIMDQDWFWHRFVSDLSSGAAQEMLAEIVNRVGEPLTVLFHAAFWSDPTIDFDPYAKEKGSQDMACFTFDGERLKLSAEDSMTSFSLLEDVVSCVSLGQVAKCLEALPNTDWVWVSAYFGTRCSFDQAGQGSDTWSAAVLWERALQPFWPWFR